MANIVLDFMTSLVGAGAAIVSALTSWWSYTSSKKSKGYAEQAKIIKDQLLSHRKTSELSALREKCAHIRGDFRKYGASGGSSQLAGLSTADDADSIVSFAGTVKEHRSYFMGHNGNEADYFYSQVQLEVKPFLNAKTPDEMKRSGAKLLALVESFSATLKDRHDEWGN